jgi:nicotinamide phosphoribosyltransferase
LVTEYLPELKGLILARDGKLIIRPDSGDPVDIICGTSAEIVNICSKDELNDFLVDADEESSFLFKFQERYYRLEKRDWFIKDYGYDNYWQSCNFEDLRDNGLITDIDYKETPESKGLIECLWETFGGTINGKGYKVLSDKVGAIYGDSINYDRAERILKGLEAKGFASSNIVFGLGSYSFQGVTRDTHGFAIKATNAIINGISTPIFKDPKTDNGTKKSAKGYLMVTQVGKEYQLVQEVDSKQEKYGCLRTVFKDGLIYYQDDLETIRERVESYYD